MAARRPRRAVRPLKYGPFYFVPRPSKKSEIPVFHNEKTYQKPLFFNQKVEEKIANYKLGNDRADVIDHALKIYLKIIAGLGIKNIKATKWGVSDSIAVKIFHELYSKKISIYKN